MDYIAHHGVKGQKWGVRRYQNPDGTLSDEGKRHYGVGNNKMFTPNTKERIKNYAKGGLKLGVAAGAALGVVAGASFVSDVAYYMPSVVLNDYTAVLKLGATIAGQAAVENAIPLGITGLGYGAIIGLNTGVTEDGVVRRKYGRA